MVLCLLDECSKGPVDLVPLSLVQVVDLGPDRGDRAIVVQCGDELFHVGPHDVLVADEDRFEESGQQFSAGVVTALPVDLAAVAEVFEYAVELGEDFFSGPGDCVDGACCRGSFLFDSVLLSLQLISLDSVLVEQMQQFVSLSFQLNEPIAVVDNGS